MRQTSRARIESLIERYQRAAREWNDAVKGLRNADYFSPNITRAWNVKDVLGHLLSYTKLMASHIKSYQKGKRLASPRSPSYSYFNRREAARLKRLPVAKLRADFRWSFRELVRLLAQLSDDDLNHKFKLPWWNSEYVQTFGSILREEATHISIHASEVSKWREKNRL